MDFRNAKELLELCRQTDLSISEIMRQREIEQGETTGEEADCRMAKAYEIMQQSARTPVNTPGRSMGGLIGGEARRLSEHQKAGKSMCGSLLGKAIMYAMAVLETNSSMGLIVAAPTAGSAGIVPGLMIAMQEEYGFTDEQMIQALYNAGAIGYLAMRNATVAGAVGGCQAEVGVASAMAASAAAELLGASPKSCLDAASTVLMNMLGLVCDPVAGLVEVPCIKRNVIGAMGAVAAADMALAGIRSNIPADQVFDAMREIGDKMDASLRETGFGGLAATPEGIRLRDRLS